MTELSHSWLNGIQEKLWLNLSFVLSKKLNNFCFHSVVKTFNDMKYEIHICIEWKTKEKSVFGIEISFFFKFCSRIYILGYDFR